MATEDKQHIQPEKKEVKDQKKSRNTIIIVVSLIVLLITILACCSNIFSGTSSSKQSTRWNCTEYEPPYRVVQIRGEADVYGGVDEPNPSRVKGHITGGAAGVEASCSKSGEGSFYRLSGVDWWGWVRSSKTQ